MQKKIKRLFLNKELYINLLILFFVILIFLIIGEILSRIILGKVLVKQYETDGFYYLKPNQEGWYPPPTFEKTRINNIGSRGRDVDIDWIKENNKYVFFGDSFTFGWILKDDETLPYHFQKSLELSDNQVINFAVGGYGVDHMTTSYDRNNYLFKEGDIFFLVLIDHDFVRKIEPLKMNPLKFFFWEIKRHSSFLSLLYESTGKLQFTIKKFFGTQIEFNDEYFDEKGFEKVLQFNSILKENDQKLLVVFYEYNETNFSKKAVELCNKNNITCITNVPSFIDNLKENEAMTAKDGHPSNYSNKVVAEGLANFIKENNLLIK